LIFQLTTLIFILNAMTAPVSHRQLARAAFCAALGCASLTAEAEQNTQRLSVDIVDESRLPVDTAWRVTAGASLTKESWCLSRWLKCTAFVGAEGRQAGSELLVTVPTFRNAASDKPRNLITDLVSGLRFDIADTRRGTMTGPLYVQFKVARRGPEIRSSVPIPRRKMATLAVGMDF
jgi:hypothetical protein